MHTNRLSLVVLANRYRSRLNTPRKHLSLIFLSHFLNIYYFIENSKEYNKQDAIDNYIGGHDNTPNCEAKVANEKDDKEEAGQDSYIDANPPFLIL